MSTSDRDDKLEELQELRARMVQLEEELATEPGPPWQATRNYTAYYATTGFMLGMFGAAMSLMFNVVGSLLVGKDPLQIIRVYLTFPLGERALDPALTSGLILAIGVCLYLGTGMLMGMFFQVALARFTSGSSLFARLALASVLGILVWLINFYGILSWLQPMLFGGRWIVDEIPPLVAVLTHLVFAWTMALIYPLGEYTPYKAQTEAP